MIMNYDFIIADFKPYLDSILANFTEEEIGHMYCGDILHFLLEQKLINRDPASMDKANHAIRLLQFYAFQRKFGSMRETA